MHYDQVWGVFNTVQKCLGKCQRIYLKDGFIVGQTGIVVARLARIYEVAQ